MAILDRLFPLRPPTSESLQTRKSTGHKMYSETPGVLFARSASSAGVHVDEHEALTISAVFAACTRLANIAATLPIGVYERLESGNRVERPTNPASRILSIEANPAQTAFVARHFMQFWKPLFGSACAEIGWDGAGRPRFLWPLEPWRVYPEYDEREQLYYLVDGKRKVAAGDMIYVPHVTEDGVCGRGFIHYALESLGTSIAADRSAGRFYENDMRPGGMLVHEGNPAKPQRDEFREEWKRHHGGVENRGKTGVIWGGWKWVRDAGMIDPDKAQLLESRSWTVLEVARWFNIPPHWLAELGRATWGNVESESIEALKYAVGPMLAATEQEYDRKLLDPPRLYCKHNVNALLRGDMKARGEWYQTMMMNGAFTINKVLAYEDENGIGPDGDRRFVPVNWQPLDDLMTGGEAQRKLKEAGQPPAAPAGNAQPSGGNPAAPPAKPAASQRTSAALPEMIEALRAVAEHALSGLSKKEINEARRAAKKPNEITRWMDGFYPDFERTMAEGLVATAKLMLAVVGESAEVNVEREAARSATLWSGEWAAASRAGLLAAMECKPEEWPAAAAALFGRWEGRAAGAAAQIAGGVSDAR